MFQKSHQVLSCTTSIRFSLSLSLSPYSFYLWLTNTHAEWFIGFSFINLMQYSLALSYFASASFFTSFLGEFQLWYDFNFAYMCMFTKDQLESIYPRESQIFNESQTLDSYSMSISKSFRLNIKKYFLSSFNNNFHLFIYTLINKVRASLGAAVKLCLGDLLVMGSNSEIASLHMQGQGYIQ